MNNGRTPLLINEMPDFFDGNLPCRGLAELFMKQPIFKGRNGTDESPLEPAKGICRTECKVRRDCLGWALQTQQRGAVWGGASDKERESMEKPFQEGLICLL